MSIDISIEYHLSDGFTLYASDAEGYLVHMRYIGYTRREAERMFRAWIKEGCPR